MIAEEKEYFVQWCPNSQKLPPIPAGNKSMGHNKQDTKSGGRPALKGSAGVCREEKRNSANGKNDPNPLYTSTKPSKSKSL